MAATPPRWDEVTAHDWDVYDLSCVLGIQDLQDDYVKENAPRICRKWAVETMEDGVTLLHPEAHKIRSTCKFPLWKGHMPQAHQLWTVVTYFACAYSADVTIHDVQRFFLFDDTGLGKTTQMAMIIAYHTWVVKERCQDASFMTPVMRPHKPLLFPDELIPNGTDLSLPVFYPIPQWDTLKPILIVTKKGIHEQTYADIFGMLDSNHFSCFGVTSPKAKSDRTDLYCNRLRPDSTRVPVGIVSWPTLGSEFNLVYEGDTTSARAEDKTSRGRGKISQMYHIRPEYKGRTLYDTDWSMVFMDEVDDARNPETNTSSNARLLAGNASVTFGLTATPVHNTPLDLLNIFRAVGFDTSKDPHVSFPRPVGSPNEKTKQRVETEYKGCHNAFVNVVLRFHELDKKRLVAAGNRREAKRRRVEDLRQYDKEEADAVQEIADTIMQPLVEMTTPRMVRRTPSTLVLGRPIFNLNKYTHTEKWVTLSEAYRTLYSSVNTKVFGAEAREVLVNPEVALEGSFPRDRQHARALKEAASAKVREAIALIKAITLEDKDLPESQQRKVIIYLHWQRFIPLILNHLSKAGIAAAALSGPTRDEDRSLICTEFQKDESHRACKATKGKQVVMNKDKLARVLIITDAASSGINLHRANVMINIDQPWTAARRNQIIGRIHRYGQTRHVQVYDILVEHTIDGELHALIQRKAQYAAVLDQDAGLLSSLLVSIPQKAIRSPQPPPEPSIVAYHHETISCPTVPLNDSKNPQAAQSDVTMDSMESAGNTTSQPPTQVIQRSSPSLRGSKISGKRNAAQIGGESKRTRISPGNLRV